MSFCVIHFALVAGLEPASSRWKREIISLYTIHAWRKRRELNPKHLAVQDVSNVVTLPVATLPLTPTIRGLSYSVASVSSAGVSTSGVVTSASEPASTGVSSSKNIRMFSV